MLYIIGLGLGDENDITLKGLKAVKTCDIVLLEHYTSLLGVDTEKLVCWKLFFSSLLFFISSKHLSFLFLTL